ncbi:MAG: lactate utilization protein [Desulfobulbus sp.]|jgi:hypothetical protein|nr:lactate utilization protein [Desulfobulbus sp.]
MHSVEHRYWQLRLERCQHTLAKNNFESFVVANPAEARDLILHRLLPAIKPGVVSWGDSMTLAATGVLEAIRSTPDIRLIETFASDVEREEILERRRQALLADLFFTGTNAITDKGQLVNLDMVGNRVAGITFGPKHVILTVGRNKLVSDLAAAMERIRSYAAPLNVLRHPGIRTPCALTAQCHDCASPDRLCNTWTITEKSFPAGRIRVILINQDLGL